MAEHQGKVKGLMVSLNREEVGQSCKVGALTEIQETYGFPTSAIVSMSEVTAYLYNKPYKGKIYIDDERKGALDNYFAQYGIKK